jgi:energy-coupling factor transport system ATP-binding protein
VQEIINLENVFYSYPNSKKWALEDISLSIAEGEFFVVMGDSGAGKSTFCRLFNGIIPHFFGGRLLGSVTVDGERTSETTVARLALKTGIALDDPDAQVFTSSVKSEAAFALENFLLPPDEIKEKTAFALGAVGLSGFEERESATLSGGEKQRLAIACALAMAGKILVLDEPLARLDPEGALEVLSVIKQAREKYRITVIMAICGGGVLDDKIVEYADRVCTLENGRALFCGGHALSPRAADINSVFPLDNVLCEKPPAVKISGFCYSYNSLQEGVENINLTIADNDFAAITGRNGCGKTTLLKSITGLLRPSAGEIFIRQKNTKDLSISAISREIGFVMQNPSAQLFTDSVYKEVSFALKNFGVSKEEIQKRAQDALLRVGLDDMDAFPHALSRADRTKVVIAAVLAMGCKIIIFDEADSGLDYKESRLIMDIAKELHVGGFTIVFVTHNISLACEYARRLIMMDKKGITMDRKKQDK